MKKNLVILLSIFLLTSFLVACGPKEEEAAVEVSVLDIKAIHKSIKEEFGKDYLPDTSLSLEELVELTGVDKDSIDEFIAEVSKNDNTLDRFIAINAKKDTSYDLVQMFLRYKEKLDGEALDYPDSFAKIKASKVVRKGDSVFFIMLGRPNSIEDQQSEEAIVFSQEEVQRSEAIIDEVCG